MTSARKEQLKQLKAPDQFQVKVMAGMDWAVKNARLLGYIAAPVALVIAGAFVVQFFVNQKKLSRQEALGKIDAVYDKEARKASDARQALMKKVQELEQKAPSKTEAKADALAATKPATPDPKIQAEKTALEAQAKAIKPDHTASSEKYLEYFKQHENDAEGWLAGMNAARIYLEQEKLPEAQKVFEEIALKAKDNKFYQTQSRLALIGVYEDQADYDKALSQVDTLEKSNDADLKPRLLLAKGRLQLLKNAKAEAKTTLSGLVEAHGSSPEAQKARSLLALING